MSDMYKVLPEEEKKVYTGAMQSLLCSCHGAVCSLLGLGWLSHMMLKHLAPGKAPCTQSTNGWYVHDLGSCAASQPGQVPGAAAAW